LATAPAGCRTPESRPLQRYAALLYKAKALDLAAQVTCLYLGQGELTARGRSQLKELLEVIWDEQLVQQQGYEYSGEELWFALRGGEVGAGTAPVDTALHYIGTANHLTNVLRFSREGDSRRNQHQSGSRCGLPLGELALQRSNLISLRLEERAHAPSHRGDHPERERA